MPDEVQHVHRTVPTLTVDLKVAHTTRGDTWEVEVKGAAGPDEAVAAFTDTRAKLEPHLTVEKGATKE